MHLQQLYIGSSENINNTRPVIPESGRLEFGEFVTLAAKFIVEEDAEAMQKELREAFRLYDKEGKISQKCVPKKIQTEIYDNI